MASTPSRAKTPNGAPTNQASKGGDGGHELQDLDSKPLLPIEEDIMQLARLGEIGAIQKLFDRGMFDAQYKDEQGITPLHVGCHIFFGMGLGNEERVHYARMRSQEDTFANIYIFLVGSNKQPLRPLPFPHTTRGKYQCKRRRCGCDTSPLGRKEMPLLHCQPPPPKWRRSSPDRRSRIQSPPLRSSRRKCLPNRPSPAPRHTRRHTRCARPHKSNVGCIQRLRSCDRSFITMGSKRRRKRRTRLHSPPLVPSKRRPTPNLQISRIRLRPLRRNKRRQKPLHRSRRNEINETVADGTLGMRIRL
jgi:hypothetical protein